MDLAFAVPKGRRLDWLLEKAAELGAASLRPVVFQRSVAGGGKPSDSARQRWLAHCIAAAKQCGLNFLPEILPHLGLDVFLSEARGRPVVLGDTGEDAAGVPAALKDLQIEAGGKIGVLVGPEGGLTDDERSAALAAGCIPVRIGRMDLRIETAAVALLAAIRAVGG